MATVNVTKKNPETGQIEIVEMDEVEFLRQKHGLSPTATEQDCQNAETALHTGINTESAEREAKFQAALAAYNRGKGYTAPQSLTQQEAIAALLEVASLVEDAFTIFEYLAFIRVDQN